MSKKNVFEEKIKPVLTYIGAIGAGILIAAYIIIVLVLIKGFKAEHLFQTTIFGIVNAAMGFTIMQFLKIQGISFAQNLPENLQIIKEYNEMKVRRAKKKRKHDMKYFWGTTVTKDILTKCGTLGATTAGLVYICIQGSNDFTLLLAALVNLLMFVCFGLLSLCKAYDFYNNEFVNYMKEYVDENKQSKEENKAAVQRKNEEFMAVAQEKCAQQGNAIVGTNSGSDILDTSLDTCAIGPNSVSVVVDSSKCSDNILGGPINPCSTFTDSTSNSIKENIYKEK